MLTPYSRGRGTWEEHLKSIEYLEAIHEQSENIQSEIDLKVSDDTLEKIASHESLFSIFKERYNEQNRTIKEHNNKILNQ